MKLITVIVLLASLVLLAAGCKSSPAARIVKAHVGLLAGCFTLEGKDRYADDDMSPEAVACREVYGE